MFKNIANAFKVADIRKRLLFTMLMVLLVRFGCQIATPGVNIEYIRALFESMNNSSFNFFNSSSSPSL